MKIECPNCGKIINIPKYKRRENWLSREELRQRIIDLLKPKDPLDKFITWRTIDIADELGYKNVHSNVHHILKLMESAGIVENVSKTRRCIWQLKNSKHKVEDLKEK